jgi:hypothetical protein
MCAQNDPPRLRPCGNGYGAELILPASDNLSRTAPTDELAHGNNRRLRLCRQIARAAKCIRRYLLGCDELGLSGGDSSVHVAIWEVKDDWGKTMTT